MTDPNVPAAPAPQPAAAAPGSYPGKGLGIAGLILSIFVAIVGLILSIVALRQSKKAGYGNVPAVVGIIIGILGSIGWIIFWIVIIGTAVALASQCAELGPGVHEVGGVTITCS
ncbi:DUF4190 domain-containing protein [Protaetiibacter intestinalis]|uniref:DUF4190 domain-containing protein n=1 Tax=Protaetiibacter intestinalis TaxID=2419774 RepID=A0A387B2J7_9MICO|nr:DUF4190 domain-containing protein [Protaetiibacter intestinalis]AYF97774.1 DUF4190 domain-containing protein [Protaetiibacter intestinalis]